MALALALIANVLAIAAIIWQFLTWRWSGPKIKVSVHLSAVGEPGGLFEAIRVVAVNDGRFATQIIAWGVIFASGTIFPFPGSFQGSDACPITLDPKHRAGWLASIPDIKGGDTGIIRFRGFVGLATGETMTSKKFVTLKN